MSRVLVLAIALAVPVSAARADDLMRYARFTQLNAGATDAYEVRGDRPLRGGLTISGEKITLDSGSFTASVQKVAHADFEIAQVSAQGHLPLDDAFFADPITAAVNDLLNGSKVTIGQFRNLLQGPEPVDVPVKDISLTMAQKSVTGSLKALVLQADFHAHASYEKASKKLTLTLESVSMGGHAVPLDLTFYVVGQILHYPFVTLANPDVVVDLSPFLPNVGVATAAPDRRLP